MSVSNHHIDQIQQLLSGQLSPDEEKSLREDIAQSEALQHELKLQQQLMQEFEELGKQELKGMLHRNHGRYLWFAFLWKWKWLIGLAFVGGGLSLSFLFHQAELPVEPVKIPTADTIPATRQDTVIPVADTMKSAVTTTEAKERTEAPKDPIASPVRKIMLPMIRAQKEDQRNFSMKNGELLVTGANELPADFRLIYLTPYYYVRDGRNYYQITQGNMKRVRDVRLIRRLGNIKRGDKEVRGQLISHQVVQQDTTFFVRKADTLMLEGDTIGLNKEVDAGSMRMMMLGDQVFLQTGKQWWTKSQNAWQLTIFSPPAFKSIQAIPVYEYNLESGMYENEE